MPITHQWQNRYRAPIPGGQTISGQKPGEQIARAITELQGVVDSLLGQDGKGNQVPTKTETTEMITDGITRSETIILIQAAVNSLLATIKAMYGETPELPAEGQTMRLQTISVCVDGVQKTMTIYGTMPQ